MWQNKFVPDDVIFFRSFEAIIVIRIKMWLTSRCRLCGEPHTPQQQQQQLKVNVVLSGLCGKFFPGEMRRYKTISEIQDLTTRRCFKEAVSLASGVLHPGEETEESRQPAGMLFVLCVCIYVYIYVYILFVFHCTSEDHDVSYTPPWNILVYDHGSSLKSFRTSELFWRWHHTHTQTQTDRQTDRQTDSSRVPTRIF